MKSNFVILSTMGGILLLSAGQITKATAQPAVISDTDQVTATVESVDQKDRTVLLSGPKGDLLTVKAGPEVRNLAQVKPGDRVIIRYHESLAVQMAPPTTATPPVQTTTRQTTAPLGQRPAGTQAEVTRARVTITSVDRAHNRVSFVGPARIERTAQVEDPEMRRFLRTLKPGDQVELTYTDALAFSVEPAGG